MTPERLEFLREHLTPIHAKTYMEDWAQELLAHVDQVEEEAVAARGLAAEAARERDNAMAACARLQESNDALREELGRTCFVRAGAPEDVQAMRERAERAEAMLSSFVAGAIWAMVPLPQETEGALLGALLTRSVNGRQP